MPSFKIKSFDDLSKQELYELLRLRAEVFVVEQNCPYQDLDNKDQLSEHLFYLDNKEQIVGYTRLLKPGLSFEDASSIGRVLTPMAFRRKGHGRPLIKESIRICKEKWPTFPIKIEAQTYLLDFYKEAGFTPYGEVFLLDGIDHIHMQL